MKKLYLDNVIFDRQRNGGISVVWYELLNRLKDDNDFRLCYIDNKNLHNQFRNMLDIPAISKSDRYPPISYFFPVDIKDNDFFLFHSSYYRYCTNKKAINITTVHDFTFEHYLKGIRKEIHSWQKFRALRHSDFIVCISENTKKDLCNFLPDIDERKVRVIYNGVSDDYCENDCNVEDIGMPFSKNKYVVFVGSRVNYKNFELTVRSVAKTPYNLLIVGSQLTDKESVFLKSVLPDRQYYCTGFLKNKDLNTVYNNAAALVYPSIYEGFGIPIIEAQKAGCPVIAYNGSSVPEVIGKTPLLMTEPNEEELINKLEMLSNIRLMKEVRKIGIENAKRFSWDRMYQEYVNLYNEALL